MIVQEDDGTTPVNSWPHPPMMVARQAGRVGLRVSPIRGQWPSVMCFVVLLKGPKRRACRLRLLGMWAPYMLPLGDMCYYFVDGVVGILFLESR